MPSPVASLSFSISPPDLEHDARYEEKGFDYPLPYVRWTEGRNLRAVMDLVASGDVDLDPLMTHEFGIGEAEQAYEMVTGDGPASFMGIDTSADESVADYRDADDMFIVDPVDYSITPRPAAVVNHVETGAMTNCPLQSAAGAL